MKFVLHAWNWLPTEDRRTHVRSANGFFLPFMGGHESIETTVAALEPFYRLDSLGPSYFEASVVGKGLAMSALGWLHWEHGVIEEKIPKSADRFT
jgi:hypothetical protein